MRRLGRKHGQESVITKKAGKPARLHDTESKQGKASKSFTLGKAKAGKNPSGQGETSGTKVRKGKLDVKLTNPQCTMASNELIEKNKSGDSSLHDWFSKSKSSDGKLVGFNSVVNTQGNPVPNNWTNHQTQVRFQ